MPLNIVQVAALPGMLGVYEIADTDGVVVRIGKAGGLTSFGLRSALGEELAAITDPFEPRQFRVEITQQYQTRYAELLMVHVADHGCAPFGNDDDLGRLGRLSPD